MATHSSVLAWRIPRTGGLVGCHLWGHTELDTTEVTQQQQQQQQSSHGLLSLLPPPIYIPAHSVGRLLVCLAFLII